MPSFPFTVFTDASTADVAKEGLKYGDDAEDEAEIASIMSKFEPLAIFLQAKLKDSVKKGRFPLPVTI